MPRLRRLSGYDVIAILKIFGFIEPTRRGSHVKLRRHADGASQSLTVPTHRELDTGTLRAILREAGRFVPESDLPPHFYTE
jgi:predicted RNA binding protein YcfA (HicA-like mRNA interferase family)